MPRPYYPEPRAGQKRAHSEAAGREEAAVLAWKWKERCDQAEDRVRDLEQKLADARRRIPTLEQQADRAEADNRSLKSEIASLQGVITAQKRVLDRHQFAANRLNARNEPPVTSDTQPRTTQRALPPRRVVQLNS